MRDSPWYQDSFPAPFPEYPISSHQFIAINQHIVIQDIAMHPASEQRLQPFSIRFSKLLQDMLQFRWLHDPMNIIVHKVVEVESPLVFEEVPLDSGFVLGEGD